MKTFVALCLVLFAVSIASGFQTSDWVKFSSAAGNFSLSFPKQPKEEKTTIDKPYPSYTSNLYVAREEGEVFLAGWVDYEASYVFNSDKELEASRDNFVKSLKGKLLTSNKILLGTYRGLDFTGEFENSQMKFYFKSKVFIVGKRPYMLTYVFLQGKESIARRNRFFSSFRVTPKT